MAVFAGVQGFRDTSLEYAEDPLPFTPAVKEPLARVHWEDLDTDEREELAAMVARVLTDRAISEPEDAKEEDDGTTSPF
jgi:hypothetical protein